MLILGDVDFSLSVGIISTFGNGHKVVATSTKKYNQRFDGRGVTHRRIEKNVQKLKQFDTLFDKRETIILHNIDPLNLYASLKRELKNERRYSFFDKHGLYFDIIVYPLPIGVGAHYQFKSKQKMKQIFEKLSILIQFLFVCL